MPTVNFSHEAHPEKYRNAYIKKFGRAAYDELYARSHSNQKFGYNELLELYQHHLELWNELKRKVA